MKEISTNELIALGEALNHQDDLDLGKTQLFEPIQTNFNNKITIKYSCYKNHCHSITISELLAIIKKHYGLNIITKILQSDKFLKIDDFSSLYRDIDGKIYVDCDSTSISRWVNNPSESLASLESKLSDSTNPKEINAIKKKIEEIIIYNEFLSQKRKLPVVYFSGEFNGDAIENNFIRSSFTGLLQVDLDCSYKYSGIPNDIFEEMEDMIYSISQLPSCLMSYNSSRQFGYHMIFRTTAERPEDLSLYFNQLSDYLYETYPLKKYGLEIDKSVIPHYKGLFVPFNEDIYYNPMTTPFDLHEDYKFIKPSLRNEILTKVPSSDEDIKAINNFKLDVLHECLNNDQFFFSDFPSWFRMLLTVKNMHSIMEYIDVDFDRIDNLSLLGHNYNYDNNLKTWESILENEQRNNNASFKGLWDSVGNPTLKYSIETAVDTVSKMGRPKVEDNPNKIYIEKYINEEDGMLNNHNNQIINSDPGTGKTSYYLKEFSGKVIIMVPYKVAVDSVIGSLPKREQNKIFKIYSGIQIPQNINKYNRIVCTYDAIRKLNDANHMDLYQYTLVVDEAHNFVTSSNFDYRFTAMNLLYDSLHNFKSVKLLSGTWINAPLDQFEGFETLEFQLIEPKQYQIEIVSTSKPLSSLLNNVENLRGNQKAMVFVNNKKTNSDINEFLRTHGIQSVVINSNTKTHDNVAEIISSNDYLNNQVVIGTQSICEAISFNNKDIESIHLYEMIAPEMLYQLINRPRKSTPKIYLYLKKTEFVLNAVDINFQQHFNHLFDKHTNSVNWKYRRDVDRINYPGMIYYLDDNKQPTPCIKTDNSKTMLNQLFLANMTIESMNLIYNVDIFNWLLRLRNYGIMPTLTYGCIEDSFTAKESIINSQTERIMHHWEDIKNMFKVRELNQDFLYPLDKLQLLNRNLADASVLDDTRVREKICTDHDAFQKLMAHIAWSRRDDILFIFNDYFMLDFIDRQTCKYTVHTVRQMIEVLINIKNMQNKKGSINLSSNDIVEASGRKFKNKNMAKRVLKHFVTIEPNGRKGSDRLYDVEFICERDTWEILNIIK